VAYLFHSLVHVFRGLLVIRFYLLSYSWDDVSSVRGKNVGKRAFLIYYSVRAFALVS
jgi:hypothetical protein